MSNSPDTPLTDSCESRGEALLRKAPEQFLNLLNAIAPDYSLSVVVAKTVIAVLERENIDRVGSAYCCYVLCLKETGQYNDALSAAKKANSEVSISTELGTTTTRM